MKIGPGIFANTLFRSRNGPLCRVTGRSPGVQKLCFLGIFCQTLGAQSRAEHAQKSKRLDITKPPHLLTPMCMFPAPIRTPLRINFGINVGSIWDHFGINFGITLGSIWGLFGVNSGSSWGQLGINLGSIWGQFGINLGSIWGQFGMNWGSIWDHFGVTLVSN